ncbi:MAG TPA: 3-phosphoshikimate 1-carboxyvinyltransferase [Alteromonas australica]|jgi:3-phosphoshikimate 1-carboxyvinyltransferase|uniref:3-phosphoshikimate 1-carboxyvinyltransferase n=2 Tax=Alteromonas australica TaxID=589873 RepID=A0A350P8M7_9ALTE|nr:3-phosphoshikimate 1-carboxyvinyltransferase [Alteromonas australica]MAF71987.1 3-phosphoshikimate 1-carboxyvinyltransferase [Alteromonas sp.]MBU33477.1 3-phosphoshikimate 1-carboxyvinyltransferase [Alteromonas sp.]HAW77644.1 3-phosphoshikimate 1-carboxyvinyltransferase [Alteromonas australica]HBU51655.1 3-phosphoshikimate 1-carboxyvinyltransferase [Alteromonas australica]|tara:strand:+ start:24798 stop:26078 length:1281 start_codon:yes stop_codon:yes gene_type:complete
MEQLTLAPIAKVSGEVNVPGSKSLSNRALLLAALAEGDTELTNLLDSDDISHMLNALTQLGIQYTLNEDKTRCTVSGNGGAFNVAEPLELFLGNAGTAMRPLCAALAASKVDCVLTGEPRMEERPIGDLVDGLREANADISYLKNDGFPPLQIKGKTLLGGEMSVDGSVSSQFLTALLMAAPLFAGDVTIRIKGELVSKPYIDITLDTMAKFGVSVENDNYQTFTISGDAKYVAPGKFMVEGDASSASYFLAAGAIKGGTVRVTGIGQHSIQGDIRFADVLEAMGAKVVWNDEYVEVTGAPLKGVSMDMNHIPDAAMTIATTALFAEGPTTMTNIYNWRVKETDRLAAMATELQKLGAKVEEGHDSIKVWPTASLKHAEIDTYNDHRIAMCFSLVALSDTPVTINDPGCTRKTFPDYFTRFATLYS